MADCRSLRWNLKPFLRQFCDKCPDGSSFVNNHCGVRIFFIFFASPRPPGNSTKNHCIIMGRNERRFIPTSIDTKKHIAVVTGRGYNQNMTAPEWVDVSREFRRRKFKNLSTASPTPFSILLSVVETQSAALNCGMQDHSAGDPHETLCIIGWRPAPLLPPCLGCYFKLDIRYSGDILSHR